MGLGRGLEAVPVQSDLEETRQRGMRVRSGCRGRGQPGRARVVVLLCPRKAEVVSEIRLARRINEGCGQGDPMIRTDEQLAVVREQLGRIERALGSLRRRVTNERNVAV